MKTLLQLTQNAQLYKEHVSSITAPAPVPGITLSLTS